MSRIELKHVWKIYPRGKVVGVKDLTFTCENKEFLAILGPSGGGKSSTLRMLAGLEEITRGEILFDGKVVNLMSPAERNIALAFESYALYQRLTVYENIAFGLRMRKIPEDTIKTKVSDTLRMVNLPGMETRLPDAHRHTLESVAAIASQPGKRSPARPARRQTGEPQHITPGASVS